MSRETKSITRFASKVVNPTALWWECWLMPVSPSRQHARSGYATFGDRTVFDEIYAHRIVASRVHGPIPDGYEVDHMCFTRNCVNPFHLAVVPWMENRRFQWQKDKRLNPGPSSPAYVRRLMERRESDTCLHGHRWVNTTVMNTQGRRVCSECRKENGRRYDTKRRRPAKI